MSLQQAALALETEIGQQQLTSVILISEGEELHIYTSGAPTRLIGSVAAMMDASPELIDLFIDALLIMKRAGRAHAGLERIIVAGALNH
jgi:hypothetical protein